MNRDGTPYRWPTAAPVVLNVDQGPLGDLSHEDAIALVQHAMDQWNGVTTSRVRVAQGEDLPSDIRRLRRAPFYSFIDKDDGTNPVIFDSAGSIFDALFGRGSGIAGFARPSLVDPKTGAIRKGVVMLNGSNLKGRVGLAKAVATHELGHFLNLAHSELNGDYVGLSVPGFEGTVALKDVETMYSLLLPSSEAPHPQSILNKDDIAAISAIYPTEDFAASTAAITGSVLLYDGVTPVQGVNVIARNVAHPFEDCVSYLSGSLFGRAAPSSLEMLLGAYEIRGLTPGASYKVAIAQADPFQALPVDPPNLDGSENPGFLEFWNGQDESKYNPPDDPLAAEAISTGPGGIATGIDFILNLDRLCGRPELKPVVETIEPASAYFLTPQAITLTGPYLAKARRVHFSPMGSDSPEPPLVFPEFQQLGPTMVQVMLPQLFPGAYELVVETCNGISDPVPYRATEPLATVTGTFPEAIFNDQRGCFNIDGTQLFGTRSCELVKEGTGLIELGDVFLIFNVNDLSICEVGACVPPGLFPGEYHLIVTNTSGPSLPSAFPIRVVERPPLLSPKIKPRSARNLRPQQLRIRGKNLVGASSVELLGPTNVPLTIVSTRLQEITASVPAGIPPGKYLVQVTNTVGTVTGPTRFLVKGPRRH